VLGKYRVDRVIGVGGMGMVAEAWHLDFDEKVAIKFLLSDLLDNEEAVGRFERESRVLFKIKSENVCRVIDVGKLDNGAPFMVMEYLDGYDMATLLERREPVPIETAIEYGLQGCQALANAHVRGIVHRDLKPENLFIAKEASGDMVLKLLDFGLSKEHGQGKDDRKRKLTAKEQVMGTPHYMSPEQWMDSTAVSPASDQWALGAIIFELLTGDPPFDGPQLANICSAIMNAPTPSLAKIRRDAPRGLDEVLRKSLEKHPHNRYENVGAFAVALAAFSDRSVATAKAERTLKMLQRAVYDEDDISGAWKNLRSPRAPSDMAATIKKPPKFEIFERVRSVTSTSWQRMTGHQRASKAAVGIAALVMVAITAVVIFTLTRSNDAATQATRTEEVVTTPTALASELSSATAPVTVEPAPSVSASADSETPNSGASTRAATTEKPASTPKITPRKRRRVPAPKDVKPPPPKPETIFEER
jgi:serine/threonine-protein kinase